MREQQNPSTPELHQPLLFAPSELLACGLRDAHHHPLVGIRTDDGVRSWRTSPATAWEHPLVEWARTATSYCSIVLDCDSSESQELACAVEAGYGDLPRPNVAAQRASSGHLHLGWNLRTPVHRDAAPPPRPPLQRRFQVGPVRHASPERPAFRGPLRRFLRASRIRRVTRSAGQTAPPPQGLHATTPVDAYHDFASGVRDDRPIPSYTSESRHAAAAVA